MNIDEVIQQPGQKERFLKEDIFCNLHVAVPGEVVSYDSINRTVVVQPVIREWDSIENPPLLTDVPVFFPGGASMGMTFTVEKGDECLVIMADRCIDSWLQSGGVSTPNVARVHSLSDGFAFVGFRSNPHKINGGKNNVDLFGMFYVDDDGYVCQRVKGDEQS